MGTNTSINSYLECYCSDSSKCSLINNSTPIAFDCVTI